MILRISEDCYFWSVGSMPDVNIPKWSSSILFFGKIMKLKKNRFLNIFFGLGSPRTWFFEDQWPMSKFPENSGNLQISPGRSDKLWKPSQTYFLEFRRSLRSKWVIYQPRTTIFEEVVFLWSWVIFGWFLGNLTLVDLWICDIAGEKHNILGK